jgi:phosphonatase-like hydrolase
VVSQILFSCDGGTVVLPDRRLTLVDRADGGHLIVNPARDVWERRDLTRNELANWSALVAATAAAMLDTLPQLAGGCINYWEAGNWALNDEADPPGAKDPVMHRRVHLHLLGRSRTAADADWQWGEAPRFPRFRDRHAWAARFAPLTLEECDAIVARVAIHLHDRYGLAAEHARPALVVFDLAGTTLKDSGAVGTAFTAALARHGIDVSDETLAQVRGRSKRAAILELVPDGSDRESRAAAAYADFRALFAASIAAGGVEPIDGAEAAFASLRASGIRLALTTGFDREATGLLLDAMGWSQGVFDAVVCGDDVRQGRPAPFLIFRAMEAAGVGDVRRVAAVGDTVHDLRAGDHAAVGWNIGVLSGAHSLAVLRAAPHTHLLGSVAELPALFDGRDPAARGARVDNDRTPA